MSVVNMAKNIKQVHEDYIICYKVGSFYQCYDKDTYLLSNIFDYKIKRVNLNTLVCGFPQNAISKVMAKLEREKINYIILDTRNNYDIEYKVDNGNLNKYNQKFEQSRKSLNIKIRVDKISETLIKEKNIDKLRNIEKLIYEDRKI